MSPSYYQSDNDNDDNSDNIETCERYNSSSPINLGSALRTNQRNSPTNSKRYRTHLTPMQVHVCTFHRRFIQSDSHLEFASTLRVGRNYFFR